MRLGKFFESEMKKLFSILMNVFWKNPFANLFLLKLFRTQKRAFKIRSRYQKKGSHVPPLLLISVTEKCNLRCKGCYAKCIEESNNSTRQELQTDEYQKIFDEATMIGISLVTLVGGEPLLRKDLLDLATKYPNIIFSIYTNGLLLNDYYLNLFSKHRNLIPFFSIEGYEKETDERRGVGVYQKVIDKMKLMKDNNLLYGVSITVTADNLEVVTSDGFVSMLNDLGCIYISYVEYEAMDDETVNLKLTKDLRNKHLANFNRIQKEYKKIFFTSYPEFEYNSGGCLGAGRGFFHINAYGDAEPCNFVPKSDTNLRNKTILEALESPLFKYLISEGLLENNHDGECALLANKDKYMNIPD